MTFPLAPNGASLISRERGAMVRAQVVTAAGEAPIVLDFAGVRRASYSFVDELVGELASMRDRGDIAGLNIINASDTISSHVDTCLSRRRPEAALV